MEEPAKPETTWPDDLKLSAEEREELSRRPIGMQHLEGRFPIGATEQAAWLRDEIVDPFCTGWTCPQCKRHEYHAHGFECEECGFEVASMIDLSKALEERRNNQLGVIRD